MKFKFNVTEQNHYNQARKSAKEKSAVLAYYQTQVRLANYNRLPVERFKQMLAIIKKVKPNQLQNV